MSEWKDLDRNNMPSDILVDGAWEFEADDFGNLVGGRFTLLGDLFYETMVKQLRLGRPYRIRRHKGWEAKKCPSCGSENKAVLLQGTWKVGEAPSLTRVCFDPYHNEPKQESATDKATRLEEVFAPKHPTHEEITLDDKIGKICIGIVEKFLTLCVKSAEEYEAARARGIEPTQASE